MVIVKKQGRMVYIWREEKWAIFQVKSVYNSLHDENQVLFSAKEIWATCAPVRTWFFLFFFFFFGMLHGKDPNHWCPYERVKAVFIWNTKGRRLSVINTAGFIIPSQHNFTEFLRTQCKWEHS